MFCLLITNYSGIKNRSLTARMPGKIGCLSHLGHPPILQWILRCASSCFEKRLLWRYLAIGVIFASCHVPGYVPGALEIGQVSGSSLQESRHAFCLVMSRAGDAKQVCFHFYSVLDVHVISIVDSSFGD